LLGRTAGRAGRLDCPFDPGHDLIDGVCHIAHGEVATAIENQVHPGDDLVEATHDCRERCKNLCGLVRLARTAIGDHDRHPNTTFHNTPPAS
jgi:hypothetical protein